MDIALSMVMLAEDAPLEFMDVRRELADNWPELPAATDGEQKDGTLSFAVGPSCIVVGKMPAPIPWSDLEGPCATSVLWRNAAEEAKRHQFHWIVTASGELDRVELSTLLTQATAAVMAAAPAAIGVFWCNASLVVPRQVFLEFARQVLPHGSPLHVWVDFRVGRESDSTSAGFTTGMQALGHMEFETQNCPEPPGELRERLLGLARYVVENGPVIRDGDTVGEDADERIRVMYSDSAFGHEGKVMRLLYERSSPAKPWWKLW